MAIRYRLHHKHLENFKDYLIGKGWKIEETKGFYEVLRARKPDRKRPLIIYTRLNAKEHYSVDDRDWYILDDFIKSEVKKMSKATLEEFYRSTLRAHYKTAMYRGKSLYEWAVIWFTHSNDSFFDMYGFNFNPHNYSGLYGIVREDLVAHATVRLIDHKVKVGLRGVSL